MLIADEKMSIEEVADFLECTVDSVKIAAQEGRIAAIKYGRSWVFLRAAIMQGLIEEALQNLKPASPKAKPKAAGTAIDTTRPAANESHGRRRRPPALPQIG